MLPKSFKPDFFFALLFLCCSSKQFAQNTSSTTAVYRRNPALGLHYNISNFNHSPLNFNYLNHGYALSFLDGIAGKYDYMIQGGSISPRYPLGKEHVDRRDLLHFVNMYGMRRFFADSVFINPFLGAGPGIIFYQKNIHPSFQAVTGFQFRISNTVFLHTQVSYHVNISSSINNNIAASIGLLGTILQRKKKVKTTRSSQPVTVQQNLNDIDKDGIPDNEDACPTAPGPRTFHGCPDSDGDGIPDNTDKCPTEPGNVILSGCPEPTAKAPAPVVKIDTLTSDKQAIYDSVSIVMNKLAEHIYFETDKATLTPASTQSLEAIVSILKMQHFTQLQIEGHTDNTGTHKRNEQLSKERANTVLEYLVNAGIDRKKLTTKGFGATRPVADNATAVGRAKNRRTLFVLYK